MQISCHCWGSRLRLKLSAAQHVLWQYTTSSWRGLTVDGTLHKSAGSVMASNPVCSSLKPAEPKIANSKALWASEIGRTRNILVLMSAARWLAQNPAARYTCTGHRFGRGQCLRSRNRLFVGGSIWKMMREHVAETESGVPAQQELRRVAAKQMSKS